MITRIFTQAQINDEGFSSLEGQNVVEAGEFALLCCWKSLSVTQWSVRVSVLKWRVVLSVTQAGKEQSQEGPHQHICTKEHLDLLWLLIDKEYLYAVGFCPSEKCFKRNIG